MSRWLSLKDRETAVPGVLGPLEWRVLESLWARPAPASVRDLTPEFTEIAYTTLMTTLDRLHRKGVLLRVKQGRAFYYEPRLTRTEFESARAGAALRVALDGSGGALAPLLSTFVDAVGSRDRAMLDELAALVNSRLAELKDKP
jgi:predicted transcriptional regulator